MPLSEHGYCVAIIFKMTEWVEQQLYIKFCVKLKNSSAETIQMIQKAFRDNAMSAAQMKVRHELQRWTRICWKWSTFWKACNNQNAWECLMCMGYNQQRPATDSVRTKSWSGDSKNYCAWDFDAGSQHETCHRKIRSATSATRAEGTSCCHC